LKLSWNGYGRKVYGDIVLEWNYLLGESTYAIYSNRIVEEKRVFKTILFGRVPDQLWMSTEPSFVEPSPSGV
jgi:hypothetical protein